MAVNTTRCYLEQDGKYLMRHRIKKKNDVNHDKWVGVGGKFEEAESPEECLVREVREETGLTLDEYRYRGIVTFVSDRWPAEYMHLYTASRWHGGMIRGDACAEGCLEWVDKARVPELPIWEGDKILFRLLEQDRPFCSLNLVYAGDRLTQARLDGVPLPL